MSSSSSQPPNSRCGIQTYHRSTQPHEAFFPQPTLSYDYMPFIFRLTL